MKIVLSALAPLALALSPLAQDTGTPDVPVIPRVAAATPAATVLAASPLGLVSLLPADVDMAFSMRGLGPLVRSILDSRMLAQVLQLTGEDPSSLDEIRGIAEQVLAFAGNDLFFAFANGSANETERLMLLQSAYERVSLQFVDSMNTGEFDAQGVFEDEIYADGGRLLEELLALQLPKIIVGLHPSDGLADMLLGQALELSSQLPPFIVADQVVIEGLGTFHTWTLQVEDALPPDVFEEVEHNLGAELAADFLRVAESKTVELALGVVDGALIASLGPDHSHLRLAAHPVDALSSVEEIQALAPMLDASGALSVGYISKEMSAASYVEGGMLTLGEGLAGQMEVVASMFGADVGQAPEHLREFFSRIEQLVDYDPHAAASLMWVEDGIKGASIGSHNSMGIPGDKPLRFAEIAPTDHFFKSLGTTTPALRQQSLELLEIATLLGEDALHAFASVENEDTRELQQVLDAIEALTPVAVEFWDLLRGDIAHGLGNESAMFIDFAGDLPLLPDMPALLMKNGPAPRMAFVHEVADRAQLAAAWTSMPSIMHELSARMEQLDPNMAFQFPMPLSAGDDALRSHFYELGVERAGFAPALTISDHGLVFGTSRSWNESLLHAMNAEQDLAAQPTGFLVSVRFDALHRAVDRWLTLVRENMPEVFGERVEQALEFHNDYPKVRQALDLMSGIGGMEYRRHFDQRWHSTWHLEITDID